MNLLTQYILAMLLTIIAPGKSIHSRVAIPLCDTKCQQTLLCKNQHHWKCRAPKFSQQLYEKYLVQFQQQGLDANKAMQEAKLRSFTRPETYEEGLVRYAIIAQAIADVAEESTLYICKQDCKSQQQQCSQDQIECEEQAETCHQSCIKTAPWIWNKAELAFMIATVTNQESGYRADVHGGTGALGRGDCQWKYSNGKRAAPFARGAAPVPGTCRSVCLGQINIGSGTTSNGWSAQDLVGIDYTSTKRCITSVAHYLSRSRMLCTKWNKTAGDWAKATFTAYGTGASCKAYAKQYEKKNGKKILNYGYRVKKNGKVSIKWSPFPPDNAISKRPIEEGWPAKRAGIFHRYYTLYRSKSLNITPDVQTLLTEKYIENEIQYLLTASQTINWMRPLTMPTGPDSQSGKESGNDSGNNCRNHFEANNQ